MADSIRERVARAIYEINPEVNTGQRIPWDDLAEGSMVRPLARAYADAAIAAMREPTEAMVAAGHRVHYPHEALPVLWRAMIDAALAE